MNNGADTPAAATAQESATDTWPRLRISEDKYTSTSGCTFTTKVLELIRGPNSRTLRILLELATPRSRTLWLYLRQLVHTGGLSEEEYNEIRTVFLAQARPHLERIYEHYYDEDCISINELATQLADTIPIASSASPPMLPTPATVDPVVPALESHATDEGYVSEAGGSDDDMPDLDIASEGSE